MYSSQDPERFGSGLPSIHHSGLLDTGGHRHRIQTVDDSVLYNTDRSSSNHVRFASSAGASGIRDGLRESVNTESAVFYPRPPSPTHNGNKKMLLELQDQVTMFRDELHKRDKLIQQLTSMETAQKTIVVDTSRPVSASARIEETFSAERINALASCRSEVASLQVKVETLNSQLMDTKCQMDARDEKIQQLKYEAESARENEAKHRAISDSLRMQVIEFESKFGGIENAASRGEVAVQTLQTQLKEANQRILDLESRLRTHVSERETLTTHMTSWERKYHEVTSKISSYFSDGSSATDPDTIITKVSELMQENASLRGKIYSMKEYTNNAELETKACRETIMRLVTEAEKEQKSATKYSLELDSLRLDRDSAVAKHRELEMEIKVLRDRCESASNAMMATRKELEEKEFRFAKYENESRSASTAVRSMELAMKGFREKMASLLSIEGHMPIQAVDEAIHDRVMAIVMALRDKSTQIEVLETKVKNFAEQLDRQYDMNKSADSRAKRVETDFYGIQEQVRKLEDELAAGDALRDGLRMDKDKYLRFMESLANIFNVGSITMDVGFDMAVETLLAKSEQLVRQENDTLNERKTSIYNLQRKIKANKEQLESRDLHIDLLRKKVASMEERLNSRGDQERERETEAQRSKKLMKLSEKYKQELHHARLELAEMKARLMEGEDAKSRTFEQERAIDSLENKMKELDMIRHKQAQKITNLKDTLDIKSQEVSTKHESVNNTIQALTGELRATKGALDEVTQKERQLLDLRQVVARMLGLDINSLAVPDYEIIARLEKLILAQQSSGVTVAAVDNLMDGMGDGFRAGYEGAGRVFRVQRSRSPAKVTTIKNSLRTRSRSMSPSKKKDNRSY